MDAELLLAPRARAVPRPRCSPLDDVDDDAVAPVRRAGRPARRPGAAAAPDRPRAVPLPRARRRARASSCRGRRPSCWPAGCSSGSTGSARRSSSTSARARARWRCRSRTSTPGARVTAVERDPGAIEWTRHNAAARGGAGTRPVDVVARRHDRPRRCCASSTAPSTSSSPTRRTCPTGRRVPREVADHDPPLALWGGPDGLDVVRGLLVTRRPAAAARRAARHRARRPAGRARCRRWCARTGGLTDVEDHRRPRRPAPLHDRPPGRRPWGRLAAPWPISTTAPTPRQRAAGLDAATAAIAPGRAGAAADRHRLRRRLPTRSRRRPSPGCSPPRTAAGRCRCRCSSREASTLAGLVDQPAAGRQRAGAGVLAGRAHPRPRARAVPGLGPRATPRGRWPSGCPDDEVARDLLRRTGPLAVSSANRSGRPAATTAQEAVEQLGAHAAVVLDGGPRSGSAASTIVDCTAPTARVLRVGAIPVDRLREVAPEITD